MGILANSFARDCWIKTFPVSKKMFWFRKITFGVHDINFTVLKYISLHILSYVEKHRRRSLVTNKEVNLNANFFNLKFSPQRKKNLTLL